MSSLRDAVSFEISRRTFLQGLSAAAAVSLTGGLSRAEQTAATLIAGKDPRLLIHTSTPAVMETPLPLLLEHRLTPAELLFVRNNAQPADSATIQGVDNPGWAIKLDGLLNQPASITVQELRELEQTSAEVVLQCSGNSRALFSQAAKVAGTPWGRGGMGNVKCSGVPLAKVLEKTGLQARPEARFITAFGSDTPPKGKPDFEHSMPLEDTLNRAILALDMNDKPIPAIHGGPVRLILPGIYGTMQMKWLNHLRFDANETTSEYQMPRYRVPNEPIPPGTKYNYTFQNSRFNWDMKLKSVVCSPLPGAMLPAGKVSVRGVAFNDGRAKIDTVLVSTNQGETWQRSRLTPPTSPTGWTTFEVALNLPAGKHSIWTRAVDALGRSQPLDGSIHWNPEGYEWNGVEKIDVMLA